jgi:hypothetical protein
MLVFSVPTPVVTTTIMKNKGVVSIANKVAIQMNCKVGGAPWTVEIPLKSTMVVGFDASHDTMNKGLSYGMPCSTTVSLATTLLRLPTNLARSSAMRYQSIW